MSDRRVVIALIGVVGSVTAAMIGIAPQLLDGGRSAEPGFPPPERTASATSPPPPARATTAPMPQPVASRLLRLTQPASKTVTITGPVMQLKGQVLGQLPAGFEVWSATRRFNPLDGETLSGPAIGLDAEGPCSLVEDGFDCGPVTIGNGRDPGEYRAFIVLAPPSVAALFRDYQAEQRAGNHEDHRIPHGVSGLGPVVVRRSG
jgi:hypothetical protein